MNIEKWKDIPGFEGFYQASDLGRVKSLARISEPHLRTQPEITLKLQTPKSGRPHYWIIRNGKKEKFTRTKLFECFSEFEMNLEEKIWRVIPNCDFEFKVSNHFEAIQSERKYAERRYPVEEKILKSRLVKGYPTVGLTMNNDRGKNYSVHRLVALTWIPRVSGKNHVNHMDFNRANNSVENLEWVTHQENMTHASWAGRLGGRASADSRFRTVRQFDLGGNFIKEFQGIKLAEAETGVSAAGISSCVNGRGRTAGGCIWKYSYKVKQSALPIEQSVGTEG
jgi:hypothetical protein